jgi:hypothetical protein
MMTSNVLLLNQARASHARGDLAQAARLYEIAAFDAFLKSS